MELEYIAVALSATHLVTLLNFLYARQIMRDTDKEFILSAWKEGRLFSMSARPVTQESGISRCFCILHPIRNDTVTLFWHDDIEDDMIELLRLLRIRFIQLSHIINIDQDPYWEAYGLLPLDEENNNNNNDDEYDEYDNNNNKDYDNNEYDDVDAEDYIGEFDDWVNNTDKNNNNNNKDYDNTKHDNVNVDDIFESDDWFDNIDDNGQIIVNNTQKQQPPNVLPASIIIVLSDSDDDDDDDEEEEEDEEDKLLQRYPVAASSPTTQEMIDTLLNKLRDEESVILTLYGNSAVRAKTSANENPIEYKEVDLIRQHIPLIFKHSPRWGVDTSYSMKNILESWRKTNRPDERSYVAHGNLIAAMILEGYMYKFRANYKDHTEEMNYNCQFNCVRRNRPLTSTSDSSDSSSSGSREE